MTPSDPVLLNSGGITRGTVNTGSASLAHKSKEALFAAETYRQPADRYRLRGSLGLLLSCPRPHTGNSQTLFRANAPPRDPRSSKGRI